MKLNITILYKDIFDTSAPDVDELLKEINSSIVMSLLAILNSMVQFHKSFDEIFDFLSRTWTEEGKLFLRERIKKYYSTYKVENKFFNRLIILRMMEYEFQNYRSVSFRDTTSIDEYNIFRAYVVFVEKEGNYSESKFHKSKYNNEYQFQSRMWPALINQFMYSHKVDPSLEMLKSIAFFDFLKKDKRTAKYLKRFCDLLELPEGTNYVYNVSLILSKRNDINVGLKVPEYVLKVNETLELLVRNFHVGEKDLISNRSRYRVQTKPILHREDGNKIILDWDILGNQLYTGALFNFYEFSGIKKELKLSTFKGIIGKSVIEEKVFVPLLKKIFDSKYIIKIFDDKNEGKPDAYIRDGNRIYLFEFKDNLFSSITIQESNFESFKKEVHEHLVEDSNGKNRGVGQIARNINNLRSSNFYGDNINVSKIKIRNLQIYPILVTTDPMYDLSGVNDYLNIEFEKRVHNNLPFKSIKPISCISLIYLFRYAKYLKQNKLWRLIEDYNRKTSSIRKKMGSGSFEKYINGYSSFSLFMQPNTKDNSETIFGELLRECGFLPED